MAWPAPPGRRCALGPGPSLGPALAATAEDSDELRVDAFPKSAPNGHTRSGSLPAYRLSSQQRAQLAGYLELDPEGVRRRPGDIRIGREGGRRAVAGARDP